MGRLFIESLYGPKIFKCKCCKVDLAAYEDIISKEFQGRFGRAYLFKTVVNITLGPDEDRHLMSGLHTVNDFYCSSCQQILGWRYFVELEGKWTQREEKKRKEKRAQEKAYEESQKYKEGKYILEKDRILKEGW